MIPDFVVITGMNSSTSSEIHLDHSSVVPHLHDNRSFDDARSQEFEDNFDDEVDFTPPAEDTPSKIGRASCRERV